MLRVEFTTTDVTDAIALLKDFPPSTLTDVVVDMRSRAIWGINEMLAGEDSPERLLKELEEILLKFLRSRIVCSIGELRDGRHSFWTQEIGKHFSVLLQRGGFTITPSLGEYNLTIALVRKIA